MTVRELIEKLSEFDGELTVTVWDAKDDVETSKVFIELSEHDLKRSVLISSVSLDDGSVERR